MNRFRGFVRKEFFHIFRDRRTLLILFGMPLAQILLFGYAVTNEIREARIGVLDQANDELSRELTDKLLASGYFLLAEELTAMDQIEPAFQAGQIKEVVVFEPHFAQKLQREGTAQVQVITDATDPNTAQTLFNYTASIILDYQQELRAGQGGSGLPLHIRTEPRMRYNPELKGVFLFVPGLITIILMLVSAMMTSISITREKEMGTMEVLLASPMRPAQIILGKVAPYMILSILNALIILLIGYYVFEVPVRGSLWLLGLESVLFILAALSLGIMISTVAKTQQVALMISLFGLMLPVILLSGFLFPIENMPKPLQVISTLIPARWFVTIVKSILLKGSDLTLLWKETLFLVGFIAFFLLVSVKRFKVRLE